MDPVHSNAVQALAGGTLSALKTNNILEFLIIHCLCNTAFKKTMHHLYIPCPPTTPSTQAGADRLLIQCLQSVHLEVHLGVHNENLQNLYRTPPPTTSWQVRTGANNIPPIVVYLLSTMKSCITCFYHATIPWPPSYPRLQGTKMQCLHSVHLEKKISNKWCLVAAAKHSLKWSFCLVKSASNAPKHKNLNSASIWSPIKKWIPWLNQWLNSDLFRPKKCLYTSKMADFRTVQFFATPF